MPNNKSQKERKEKNISDCMQIVCELPLLSNNNTSEKF